MSEVMNCYIISLAVLLVSLLFGYFPFRTGVDTYLRHTRRMSRTRIRKSKKGKRNYWWYQRLHEEERLGALYYVNKIYTVAWLALFVLTLAVGWVKETLPVLCFSRVLLYLLSGGMALWGNVQENIRVHGRPFVLLARSENQGFDSVLIDISFVLLFVLFACVDLRLCLAVFEIAV